MKLKRRDFLRTGATVGGGLLLNQLSSSRILAGFNSLTYPIVISTWDFGIRSNAKSFELLLKGSNSLDAVEAGIQIAENDPTINSVGYGGYPDEDGIVTLDASVMDWNGNAGSVAALEGIKNPISIAKLVMQKTKHVMLAGEGAKKFAVENGFREENLLTEHS